MPAHLIDTNVMLASSAIYSEWSNLVADAMPHEIELRELVFRALREFEEAPDFLVLDEEGTIRNEYERNMPFNSAMGSQEYGLLVLQNKLDYGLVNFVIIDVVDANGERIATLSDELTAIVTDREDRKWVASATAHETLYAAEAPIMYGAESDWFKIEAALAPHGVKFKRLLPDKWYHDRLAR